MVDAIRTFRKDPQAVLDYALDWSNWLESGEILSTSSWTVASGITQDSVQMGETSTKIWLSGGTAGESYTIVNKITTSGGRTDERTFCILVEER